MKLNSCKKKKKKKKIFFINFKFFNKKEIVHRYHRNEPSFLVILIIF